MSYAWERAFSEPVLEHGRNYADQSLIEFTQYDEEAVLGVAHGCRDYRFALALTEDGHPDPCSNDTFCSCPYDEDDTSCKHLAAACLIVEDRLAKGGRYKDWRQVLDALPKEQLRPFLVKVLSSDWHLCREFLAYYATRTPAEVSDEVCKAVLVAAEPYAYSDRPDSSDERALRHEIEEIISRQVEPLMSRGEWRGAAAVGIGVYAALNQLRIKVDGAHFYYDIDDLILDLWRDICRKGKDAGVAAVEEGIYEYFVQDHEEKRGGCYVEYDESIIYLFYFHELEQNEEHFGHTLRIAQVKLARFVTETDYDVENDVCYWLECAIKSLEALHTPIDEICAFVAPYLPMGTYVSTLMAEALDRAGKTDEAIALLEDARERTTSKTGRMVTSEDLVRYLEKTGDERGLVACLCELVTSEMFVTHALMWWQKLKEHVLPAEWEDVRGGLLSSDVWREQCENQPEVARAIYHDQMMAEYEAYCIARMVQRTYDMATVFALWDELKACVSEEAWEQTRDETLKGSFVRREAHYALCEREQVPELLLHAITSYHDDQAYARYRQYLSEIRP